MYPKPIQRLIELFSKLPGVGPRQATRMAFFVLQKPVDYAEDLTRTLGAVKQEVGMCQECFRSIEKKNGKSLCDFCGGTGRSRDTLLVAEKEMDIANLEKAGAYRGLYHVLGGVVSPLDPESPLRLRLKELHERVKRLAGTADQLEVIIATSQNAEGDATAMYLERLLEPLRQEFPKLVISRLGKGLSVGSEVEYADEVTLKNALSHRISIE